MNIQSQLQNVLTSFYIYFLRKKGVTVFDDRNMNGGGDPLQEMLQALLSALVMTLVVIMIITSPDKKPQNIDEYLKEVQKHPEETVNNITSEHRNMLMNAVNIVKSTKSKGKQLSSHDLPTIVKESIVKIESTGNFNNMINRIKDVVVGSAAIVESNLSDNADVVFSMADVYKSEPEYESDPTYVASPDPEFADTYPKDTGFEYNNPTAKDPIVEPELANTYPEGTGFKYDNADREQLPRNDTDISNRRKTNVNDISNRRKTNVTSKAPIAINYLESIEKNKTRSKVGGKSNKKRSRKHRLRRRKTIHKKK
jgi:hypothetical protein